MRGLDRIPAEGPVLHTKVSFRLAYESAGNLLGLIADRVAARQVGRNMTETLKNLKRMVET